MSFVHPLTTRLFVTTRFGATKKPVPDIISGSGDGLPRGCSFTQFTIARMAAALSFISTLANGYLFSCIISTERASATVFMNSTDASANESVWVSPNVEKVTSQDLVVTNNNRCCLLLPIQGFHLGLEIKIIQPLLVPI